MKKKIITFGEIMMRLMPQGYYRFAQAERFDVTYAGGEANVAVSLANYGMDAEFVTKVPANEIGQCAINALRKYGVDTKHINRGGNRLGIYFVEKGASQRPTKVIYDRIGSAIAEADLTDFDWNEIFEGADWFHFTGITPALSEKCRKLCKMALIEAKKKGITVSCDLNYRKKLWSREQAGQVMAELCEYVDICIANEEDAADVFGIYANSTDVVSGKIDYDSYKEAAKKLAEKFAFQKVAITLRESVSANDNIWSAMLYENEQCYFSKKYQMHIVDRLGGGDSFCGAFIYGCIQKLDPQKCIDFAAAASCLKHSIEGDFNQVSVDEVFHLANGNLSGRVQR